MRRLMNPRAVLLITLCLPPLSARAEDKPNEKPDSQPESPWVAEIERNPLLPPPVQARIDEKDEHLRNELNTPTLQFVPEIPFSEAMDLLGDLHAIRIRIEQNRLEELGLNERTPITLELPEETTISLRSSLHHQLRMFSPEATWNIVDGEIVISTYEANHEHSKVHVYPVSPLLLEVPEDYRFEASSEERLNNLMTIIQAASSGWWMDIDGDGGQTRPLKMSWGAGLAVRQTRAIQHEVAVLLTTLEAIEASHREAETKTSLLQTPSCRNALEAERLLRTSEFQIREQLRTEVEADFIDISLQEVVDFYSDLLQIPMRIDRLAMDEEGIALEDTISYSGKQELRYVLDGILSQIDCDYYFDHEMLVIAPAYRCAEVMSTSVYDVTDLIAASELPPIPNPAAPAAKIQTRTEATGGGGQGFFQVGSPTVSTKPAFLSVDSAAEKPAGSASLAKYDNSLVDAILNTTFGEWEAIGGYGGTIHFYETANARMLIVHQHRRTQEEVAELLEGMRQLKGK